MTTLIIGILIGLVLGAWIRARGFTHANSPPETAPPFHGPNYNPLPPDAVKPPPPPAPPAKRYAP